MLPVIPKPPITPKQKAAALSVAGAVDVIQLALFPAFGLSGPFEFVLDVIAAGVMVAICGFKWQFIVAFLLELFPVVDLFPTWTLFVMTLQSQAADAPQKVHASEPKQATPTNRQMIDVDAIVVPPVQSGEASTKR